MQVAVAALILLSAIGVRVADAAEPYLLQPGDLISVSVWKESELSGDLLIRPDGHISVPLAGDIVAAGRTTDQVRDVVDQRLRHYIPDPAVTVGVKLEGGNQIFVLGKVNHPGEFAVVRPVDVMQALSLAGGTTPFAALNAIHILRRAGDHELSIPFRYVAVEHGRELQQNIILESGDTVVVP